MNPKRYFLVASALMLLGCQGAETPRFTYKKANIYLCGGATDDKGVVDLSKQETSQWDLAFLETEPLIPYVPLNQVVRIYQSDLEKTIVQEKLSGDTYTLSCKRDAATYDFSFDAGEKKITIAGELSKMSTGADDDNSSNVIDGKASSETVKGDPKKAYTVSYANTGFKTFIANDTIYVPLSLASSLFHKQMGLGMFYNYRDIYVFSESTQIDQKRFKVNAQSEPYAIKQAMKDVVTEGKFSVMPEYLRRYNRDSLTFVFDNYYGLRYSLAIPSIYNYFTSFAYYEDLLSDDPDTRSIALTHLIQRFHDGHTAIASQASAWDEKAPDDIPQSLVDLRSTISSSLRKARSEAYKAEGLKTTDVRYAKDGKTAVVILDKFAAYDNAVDPKTKKTTAKMEDVLAEDTYFQTKAALEKIKAKGGVERVIIDMSDNEGGDAGTMGNLLALISPENKSVMTMHEMKTGTITATTTRLDTNEDGKIDEKDHTYGKDFKFYLLVSPCAFSCGTAYPFFAQKQGFATVIGITPGGGECVLGNDCLPNGQAYYHSAMLRVCWMLGENVVYDEAGAEIEVGFDYHQFYDLENMAKRLIDEAEDDE